MPSSRLPWRLIGVFPDHDEENAWELLHEAQDADFSREGLVSGEVRRSC
jgi:hypothetical protein